MNQDLFQLRFNDFSRALARLEEALAAPDEQPLALDAQIQRFEFSYELGWKTMKAWLALQGIETFFPKEVLAQALEAGLITDGNAWSEMLRQRNLTSHTYNQVTAEEVRLFLKTQGLSLLRQLHTHLSAPLP